MALVRSPCLEKSIGMPHARTRSGYTRTFASVHSHPCCRLVQIRKHPDWDRDTLRNDYAMLKLQTPLDFGGRHKHLMPICLPEKDDDFEGLNCTASGWGLTKDSEFTRERGVAPRLCTL